MIGKNKNVKSECDIESRTKKCTCIRLVIFSFIHLIFRRNTNNRKLNIATGHMKKRNTIYEKDHGDREKGSYFLRLEQQINNKKCEGFFVDLLFGNTYIYSCSIVTESRIRTIHNK